MQTKTKKGTCDFTKGHGVCLYKNTLKEASRRRVLYICTQEGLTQRNSVSFTGMEKARRASIAVFQFDSQRSSISMSPRSLISRSARTSINMSRKESTSDIIVNINWSPILGGYRSRHSVFRASFTKSTSTAQSEENEGKLIRFVVLPTSFFHQAA